MFVHNGCVGCPNRYSTIKKASSWVEKKKWHAAQIDVCNRLPGTLSCFAALLKRLLVAICPWQCTRFSVTFFTSSATTTQIWWEKEIYIYTQKQIVNLYIHPPEIRTGSGLLLITRKICFLNFVFTLHYRPTQMQWITQKLKGKKHWRQ